ncbi:MAG TPA: CocE/NonD family hydrolase [Candidatus Angelobacter sp.]|nr:CocE/NonD family hydrolase [Candidatus Angelobacter sp.]
MKRLLWIVALLAASRAEAQAPPFTAPDRKPEFQELQASSRYVPMRDGVRIAIDVLLPKGLPEGRKVPTLFKISRFGRAAQDGGIAGEDRFWVQHGYARVLIDERGTGASFGVSRYGPETVPDLYDLVDWVVQQQWSNGRVGAIGVSVEGTASELLAATSHPAVRAVAPLFSDYNFYTDLVRPGGIFNEWVLKTFEDFTVQMDSGRSAKRVDGDTDGTLVKQAIAEHRGNLDIYTATKQAEFLDDTLLNTGRSLVDMSIPGTAETLRKSKVPMLIFTSWYDAGTVQGTLKRFREFSNIQKIFIGAWSHGAGFNADPFVPAGPAQPNQLQQWLQALEFFDHYLKDSPGTSAPERRLNYYTIGEGQWHLTEVWPPKGLRQVTYYLNSTGELGAKPSDGKLDAKLVGTSTGDSNRWHTQMGGNPVEYAKALEKMGALTSFTTAPLAAPLEITGQPVLRLQLSCAQADPSVIAYLVAVDAKGTAFYITEGHLRLIQRKLNAGEQTLHTYAKKDAETVVKGGEMEADLTLLPTSVLLAKGMRLRLLLASGDDATFATSGEYEAQIFGASHLELPIR